MLGAGKSKEQPLSYNEQKLALERVYLFAKIEHDFGKVFYDFFYSAVNIILYNRELYSKKYFSVKKHPTFEMDVPFMRYPETIAYIDKVVSKSIAIFSAGYLEALVFEEIDSTGNLWQYSFQFSGGIEYDPYYVDLYERLTLRHRENLSELLMKVKTVFEQSSTPSPDQRISRRWRLLTVLQKYAPEDLLDDDPDATSFPMKLYLSEKEMYMSQESFYDIAPDSEETMKDPTATHVSSQDLADFEQEGMSIIEYDEDQRAEDRGSPDLFENSQQSQPSTPVSDNDQYQSPPPVSYVLDPNELLSSPMARAAGGDDSSNYSSDDTPSSIGLASPVLKDVTSGFVETEFNLFDLLEPLLDDETPVASPSSSPTPATPVTTDIPATPSRKNQDHVDPELHVIATKVISETLICNVFILHKKDPLPVRLADKRHEIQKENTSTKTSGGFTVRRPTARKNPEEPI